MIGKIIGQILSWTLQVIRPLLGPSNICPYSLGCTQYAVMQLENKPLWTALKNIFLRIIQCHPFGNRTTK